MLYYQIFFLVFQVGFEQLSQDYRNIKLKDIEKVRICKCKLTIRNKQGSCFNIRTRACKL